MFIPTTETSTRTRYVLYAPVTARAAAGGTMAAEQEADSQLTALRQYAEAHGGIVIAEFADALGRPVTPDLIRCVSEGDGDALLITRPSQAFLRRSADALALLERLLDHGMTVETPDGPVPERTLKLTRNFLRSEVQGKVRIPARDGAASAVAWSCSLQPVER